MAKDQKKAGVIISYADMIFSAVIGIFFTPFAQRMLGKSEYGIFTIATAAIGYLSMLDLGFTNAMVRFTAHARSENDSQKEHKINGMFFTFYSLIAVVTMVIGVIIYMNFDTLFAKGLTPHEISRAKVIFIVMMLSVALSFPTSVFTSIINAYEEFIFLKSFMLITNVAKYVAQILVLFSGLQSVALAVAVTVTTLLSKIAPTIYCFKKLHIKFTFGSFDKQLFKDIINYSFFIFLGVIVDQLNANTDKIVLGALVGSGAAAVYNTAYTLQNGIYALSNSIGGVFLPSLTRMVAQKNNISKISELFIKVGRIQFFIMAIVLSGFTLFGKEFISLWTKGEYMMAYPIVVLWLAYSIVPNSQSLGVSILQAQNKHRVRAIIYSIIAIFHVFLTITLSKEGSPLGEEYRLMGPTIAACISNLLGQWLTMNIYYKYVTKLDINRYWKEILKIGFVVLLYSLCGYAGTRLITLPKSITSLMGGWIALFLSIIIYCVFFIPVAWFLILNRFEKNLILELFRKILRLFQRKKVKNEQ